VTAPATQARRPRGTAQSGWTLVEVLLIIALIGIIASILVPVFLQILERAKVRKAIADMRMIEFEVGQYRDLEERYPEDLDALPPRPRLDPWGRPYVYFLFEGPGWRGRARKDRFLVPINTYFDLYSLGPDGDSRAPLQNPKSLDDVVRANDGQFYGLGRDF
jgi:general secretion pathway protein G